MFIKSVLKKCISKKVYYKYLLFRYWINSKKSNKKIEKQIGKVYYKIFKRKLDWNNPKTYTEMLNVSKVYSSSKIKTMLTDKILVRDWIKEKIGEEYLIPVYGTYDKFKEINFEKLPDKFVIKCNHDSGSVFLCEDKTQINFKELKTKYDFYLKRNYANVTHELQYKLIQPKIMIEKYMGKSISDYKFICIRGEVVYCRVDFDRFGEHKRNIYDLNWKIQPFNQGLFTNKENVSKPNNFEEMVMIARKLCKDFEQVRVDLYDIDGKIYFGEMTFTSGTGYEPFYPDKYDYELGKKWNMKNI